MNVRSMNEIAYDILSKRKTSITFEKLWKNVGDELGYNDSQAANKIASFYSAMMLDNRFTQLANNKWDLRNRHKFSETHIDTSAIVIDDDSDEEEILVIEEEEAPTEEIVY